MGYKDQIMMAPETVHGTGVTPTRGYEVDEAKFELKKNTVQSGGLNGGLYVARSNRRSWTTRKGEGSFTMDVMPRGFGLVLKQLMGSAATPTQVGSSLAYLQTHVLGDLPVNQGATIQLGRTELSSSAAQPYTYVGCRATKFSFSQDQGDNTLKVETNWDCYDRTEATGLASFSGSDPSAVEEPFHFAQWGVQLGAYGDEENIDGVASLKFDIERPQATEMWHANKAGRRRSPVINDKTMITGTITDDFVNKEDLADRFASDEEFSLIFTWTGAEIDEDTHEHAFISFSLPACRLDTGEDGIDGLDISSGDYDFVALYDNAHPPISITYQSVDTVL